MSSNVPVGNGSTLSHSLGTLGEVACSRGRWTTCQEPSNSVEGHLTHSCFRSAQQPNRVPWHPAHPPTYLHSGWRRMALLVLCLGFRT